jgi:hypothetical protein
LNFSDTETELSEFPASIELKDADEAEVETETEKEAEDAESEDSDARQSLKGRQINTPTTLRCCDVAMLQNKVTELSTEFGRLGGAVSTLRSAAAGIQTLLEQICALKTRNAQELNLNDPVVEQLSTDFIEF